MASLECKVCLQEYSSQVKDLTPRMLTCGHTICEKCAEQILDGEEVACPFDRKITNVEGGEIKSLSKNYTLLEILEERQSVETSNDEVRKKNEEVKVPCSENSDHTAVFYCKECESDLCDECSTRIHAPKSLQGHKRIPVSEKSNSALKCVLHPDHQVDFYCIEAGCMSKLKEMCNKCVSSGEHDSHEKREFELHRLQRILDVKLLLHRLQLAVIHLSEGLINSENQKKSFDKKRPIFQRYSSIISNEFNKKKTLALSKLDERCDVERNFYEKLKTLLVNHKIGYNDSNEILRRELCMNIFNASTYKAIQEFDYTECYKEGNYKTLDAAHLSDTFDFVYD